MKNKRYFTIGISLLILIGAVTWFSFKNANKSTTVYKDEISEEEQNEEKEETPEIKEEFKEGLELTNEDIGVPVMYYHSISSSEENSLILSPERFRKQMQYILDSGFTPLTLSQVYRYHTEGLKIPKKSIFITLDDGYENNYTEGYKILNELKIPATIFVQTDRVDKPGWLKKEQIVEMSQNGIDIMSHTVSHPSLKKLSYEEQLKELTESKNVLEEILGKEVYAISYPYGDYNKDTLKIVKEVGYKIAFTTKERLKNKDDGVFELQRIYSNSKRDFEHFKNSIEKAKR